jgi:hypothetical protein
MRSRTIASLAGLLLVLHAGLARAQSSSPSSPQSGAPATTQRQTPDRSPLLLRHVEATPAPADDPDRPCRRILDTLDRG